MTQQKDVLTIDQKIQIAKLAIESLNSPLVARNGIRALFETDDRIPVFPAVYHCLVGILTKDPVDTSN